MTLREKFPDSMCHSCGSHLNSMVTLGDEPQPPNAGDAALCDTCGAISVFTGSGTEIRPFRPGDLSDFPPEFAGKLIAVSALIARSYRLRGGKDERSGHA